MDNHPLRVLLVDDDEDDYILTQDLLSESKGAVFELEWVATYHAALEVMAHNNHDIYLLDYRLGEYNGLELLRKALSNGCRAPVILLTGRGDQEVDIEAMKAGAADYLDKSQIRAPLLERSIRYAIERRRAEQKIREQAALLDVTTDAILVQSLDQQILFWNKGAERLYGWKMEEVLGKKADELLTHEDMIPQLQEAQNKVTNQSNWSGELHQIGKDGKEIIVASRWTLVQNFRDTPKSILVVNTDITEKKKLEAQFLRAQRMESIGTLAGGIAHDLNNVLAPIMMAAQLLELKLTDEHSQEWLEIIENNAKRGADLVKQVVSFARGINGARTQIQIRHIISEIRQIVRETFPKSIEFATDVSQELWMVLGDMTQLHQVFMNLAVNARDAMPNGGSLRFSATNIFLDECYADSNIEAKVGSYILVTVKDTGTGISSEILDRIFEPFFTTKELGKGTGLGLSTVIGIIQSHGGFVKVHSELGKGTEFKVYLPALEQKESQDLVQLDLPLGQGELILVVDDEEAIRKITKTSLETYNYKVLTANDGISALALYVQHQAQISVVLVDMMMPAMTGSNTIQALKKIQPQAKIIAVSGLSFNNNLSQLTNLGVKKFLCKPYTSRELLQALQEVIRVN
ncbi:MAG: response regulator [Coleofasciculaceae cyanobacterium]